MGRWYIYPTWKPVQINQISEAEFVFWQTFLIPGFRCLQNPWTLDGRMNLYSKRCFGVLKLAIFEGSQPGFWILVVLISQSKTTKLWLVGLEIWTILKTSRLCLLGWTSRVIQLTSWGWQVIALFTRFYTSQVVRISSINGIKTSWWFQTIWKISVKLDHFPNFSGWKWTHLR